VAVLGRDRPADLDMPAARATPPPWSEVPISSHGPMRARFSDHFEIRSLGPAPFAGDPGATRTAGWVRPRDPGPARDDAFLVAVADAWWPALVTRPATPRPAATIAFTLQIVGGLDGLDPEAPFFHEADELVVAKGYAVEQRRLYGADGRLLTLNQQTFALIQ
jgi:hypothetical protein